MPAPAVTPLVENAGFVFTGENPWPAGQVSAAAARTLLATGNPSGRPNGDVLRCLVTLQRGRPLPRWQVDFPAHFTAQEAALYAAPWKTVTGRTPAPDAWRNPHANPELRRALARVERYLALPADAEAPHWTWFESTDLPAAGMVVIAREDDFGHGLLSSQLFALWWHAFRPAQPAVAIVASFPQPWPTGTQLSALTRAQEDLRLDLARAARSGNADAIDRAATAAYGWPASDPDPELLARLLALHRTKAAAGLSSNR